MAPGASRNVRLAILLIAWAIGGWEFCKRFVPLVPTSQVTIPEGKRQIAISEQGVSYYEFPGRRNWPVIIAILAGPPLLIGLLVKARRRKALQRTVAGMPAAATHG